MCSERKPVIKLHHHEQQEYALDRPPYRQGRKLTSVKVYTVNDESQHLLVFGVPQIKLKEELNRLASKFGIVKSLMLVNNYERDDEDKFTDIYHLHYRRIQAARFAKKQLDERCFFGGVLHVCYAPELESVAETRIKLIQRRREVAARIEANNKESSSTYTKAKPRILQRSKKHPALPISQHSECHIPGNYQCEPSVLSAHTETITQLPYGPSLPSAYTETISLPPVPSAHTETVTQSFTSYQATNNTCPTYGSIELNTLMPVVHSNQTSIKRKLPPQQSTNKRFCDLSVQSSLIGITPPSNSNCQIGKVSDYQLSDENIKSLKFLPRQISRTSTKKSKSRIVFHKK